ncbi:MAG: hypothetical protein JJT75_03085 [Opitutales bacterium]|nr:hypothetical protein [Opitutales bacterium]
MKKVLIIKIFLLIHLPFLFAEDRLADVVSENLTIYLESNLALEKQRGNDIVLDPEVVQFVEETLVEHYSHFWEMIPEDMQNDWVGDWFMESVRSRLLTRTFRKGLRHIPLVDHTPEMKNGALGQLESIRKDDSRFTRAIKFVVEGNITEKEYLESRENMIRFGTYVGRELENHIMNRKVYLGIPSYLQEETVNLYAMFTSGIDEDEVPEEQLNKLKGKFGIPEEILLTAYEEDYPLLLQRYFSRMLVGEHIRPVSEPLGHDPVSSVDDFFKEIAKPYLRINVKNQLASSVSYIMLSSSIFEADIFKGNLRPVAEAKKMVDKALEEVRDEIYLIDFLDIHGSANVLYSILYIEDGEESPNLFRKQHDQYELIYDPNWFD